MKFSDIERGDLGINVDGPVRELMSLGSEIRRATGELASRLDALSHRGKPDISYENIDRIMRSVCGLHGCKASELHDDFVAAKGMTPDQYVRERLRSRGKSMLEDSSYEEFDVFVVQIPANVYAGKYYDYRTVSYRVYKGMDGVWDDKDAIAWVNDNQDKVLADLSAKRMQSGSRTVPYVAKPAADNVFFSDRYSVKPGKVSHAVDHPKPSANYQPPAIGKQEMPMREHMLPGDVLMIESDTQAVVGTVLSIDGGTIILEGGTYPLDDLSEHWYTDGSDLGYELEVAQSDLANKRRLRAAQQAGGAWHDSDIDAKIAEIERYIAQLQAKIAAKTDQIPEGIWPFSKRAATAVAEPKRWPDRGDDFEQIKANNSASTESLEEVLGPLDTSPLSDESLDRKKVLNILHDKMKTLSNQQQLAIEMWIEGKTLKEIGDALGGLTPERVRRIVHKVLFILSRHMKSRKEFNYMRAPETSYEDFVNRVKKSWPTFTNEEKTAIKSSVSSQYSKITYDKAAFASAWKKMYKSIPVKTPEYVRWLMSVKAGKIENTMPQPASMPLWSPERDELRKNAWEKAISPISNLNEAEYQGREVKLGKPMRGDVKKYRVYVRDPKTGNIKKVNFGDKSMEIKRDDPERRKNFRARHGCGTPRASDRTKAAYWSCRMWSTKPVGDILKGK